MKRAAWITTAVMVLVLLLAGAVSSGLWLTANGALAAGHRQVETFPSGGGGMIVRSAVRVHLTVLPGCVLHKGRLAPGDVKVRPGFQVTTPLRTLLDVADSPLSQEHLDAAVREALERGLVRRRQLEEADCRPYAPWQIRRVSRVVAVCFSDNDQKPMHPPYLPFPFSGPCNCACFRMLFSVPRAES